MNNKSTKESTTSSQTHLDLPIFLLPGVGDGISFSQSQELWRGGGDQDWKQGGLSTRKVNNILYIIVAIKYMAKINNHYSKNLSPLDLELRKLGTLQFQTM